MLWTRHKVVKAFLETACLMCKIKLNEIKCAPISVNAAVNSP